MKLTLMPGRVMPKQDFAIRILVVIAAALVGAQAQTAEVPEFAVASIKPSHAIGGVTFGAGNGGAGGRNITLRTLIGLAYRLQEFQISGGPNWVASDRFDVQGKSADPKATPDQLRLMLQSLIADRFQLKFHRQMRDSPVYALVVAKDGPKIRLVDDQQSPSVDGPSPPGAGPNRGAVRIGAGSLIGNAVPLSLFSRFLSQRLDRTIIDQTNLAGRFNIQLQWAPGPGETLYDPGGSFLPPPAESSGPSVFAAIREQLGLELKSVRAPVEMFVIDHAEKPSEN
jgi:uncharacterized protein (TIGR03435 family)